MHAINPPTPLSDRRRADPRPGVSPISVLKKLKPVSSFRHEIAASADMRFRDTMIAMETKKLASSNYWETFSAPLLAEQRIGLVYHGDFDGAIGAAYAQAALLKRHPNIRVLKYWISTDELDFISVKEWSNSSNLNSCAFFDLSIVNKPEIVHAISKVVSGNIFIYDHHHVNSELQLPKNVLFENPTPKLSVVSKPVPTFEFARSLSELIGLYYPVWLYTLSIIAEGVTDFYDEDLELISFTNGFDYNRIQQNVLVEGQSLRNLSRRASRLFDRKDRSHRLVDVLTNLATSNGATFEDFLSAVIKLDGPAEKMASTSKLIDRIAKRVARLPEGKCLVVVNTPPVDECVRSVASVLRGKFPNHIFLTFGDILRKLPSLN